MQKVLVILGQTATGKSDLSVAIAKKINGEIISADSRQVYKGLDIGTGKITSKEMKGIPHYLLDVANPKRKFNVSQYKKLAEKMVTNILSRGKVPIICGGTGFYIDALVSNIVLPQVPPNSKLRKQLEQKSTTALFYTLKKLDGERARNIDAKNKVRLIRAIEIAKALGKVPHLETKLPNYQFIKIGLHLPKEKLQEKISTRLNKRIKVGMLTEALKLHSKGLCFTRMRELGLEYKYMALYLEKKISKDEMLAGLNKEIYQYAKRQMTWFKRDESIKWFQPEDQAKIQKFLRGRF